MTPFSVERPGAGNPSSGAESGNFRVANRLRHLVAAQVGRRRDPLHLQLELVDIAGPAESFIVGNQSLFEQAQDRLVEGLHPVLGGARADGPCNQVSLFLVDDAVANEGRREHDLDGRDAACSIFPLYEALRAHRPENARQLQPNLFLLVGWKDGDDPVDGFGGVDRVQGRADEVTGFSGKQPGLDRLEVPHLADQDDVGILPQGAADRLSERAGIDRDFALTDDGSNVAMEKLYWIFDGDAMGRAGLVHVVDHGGKRRTLAAARGSRDEHEAAFFGGDFLEHPGKIQLLDRAHLHRNHAEYQPDGSALLKDVDPEASEAWNAVGNVELLGLLEFLSLGRR